MRSGLTKTLITFIMQTFVPRIRSLIDRVVLTPSDNGPKAVLHSDLARILALSDCVDTGNCANESLVLDRPTIDGYGPPIMTKSVATFYPLPQGEHHVRHRQRSTPLL